VEAIYNYRLLWRVFDEVVRPLQDCTLTPGEVRLQAIKNELQRKYQRRCQYDVGVEGIND
jgi:hypothetical protein